MVKEDIFLSLEEATSRLEKAGYTVEDKGDYIRYKKSKDQAFHMLYFNVAGQGYDEHWIVQAERN